LSARGGGWLGVLRGRARNAAQRLRAELSGGADPLLVGADGGLLNVEIQFLIGVPPSDHVPFGFDHCAALRVLCYAEEPAFGPFPMLRF